MHNIKKYFAHAALTLTVSLSVATSAIAADLTRDIGAPVGDNQNSQTAGPNGPELLQDSALIEKLQRFDRERIPERVVHARGSGAYGVFTPTADISDLTYAKVFTPGTKTPVFVRFSTVMGYRGSPEQARDPRGFAVKFYTAQGNWDIVGINEPIFFIRDAIKFPDLVHALKPDPVTNRISAGCYGFTGSSACPGASCRRKNMRLAGRSARRRMKYAYQSDPNGT